VNEAFTPAFIEKLFHWVDDAQAVFPPWAPPAGQRFTADDEPPRGTVE
jgi:hypothetical protein